MSETLDYAEARPDLSPTSLRVAGWLLIAFGVLCLVHMLLEFLCNSLLVFNPAILGIWIGRGLLQRRDGWRRCAIMCLPFAILTSGILTAEAMKSVPVTVGLGSHSVSTPANQLLPIPATVCAVSIWLLFLLTSQRITLLFSRSKPTVPTPDYERILRQIQD